MTPHDMPDGRPGGGAYPPPPPPGQAGWSTTPPTPGPPNPRPSDHQGNAPAPPPTVPPGGPKNNGLAVASLICGLLWCLGVAPIVGVVLGVIARKQIRDSNGQQKGAGLALGGIIAGALFVVLLIGVGIWALLFDQAPERADFVDKFVAEFEADSAFGFDSFPSDVQPALSSALRTYAGCYYDVLEPHPSLLKAVYQDPTKDEWEYYGSIDTAALERRIEQECDVPLTAALTDIAGN